MIQFLTVTSIISLAIVFTAGEAPSKLTCDLENAQCVAGAEFMDVLIASDMRQCQFLCRTEPECRYFTFYRNLSSCWLYRDCGDVVAATCADCATSRRNCPGFDPVCGASGRCEGPDLWRGSSADEDDCNVRCQETEGCRYFNFEAEDLECSLTATCNAPWSQGAWAHWESLCEPAPLTQLLVVGGGVNGTEVFDLSVPGDVRRCPAPAPMPVALTGPVGVFKVDFTPMICGGEDFASQKFEERCFVYDDQEWDEEEEMNKARAWAAAVQVSRSAWWITGGGSFELSSTELYNRSSGSFEPGPDLPSADLRHHSAVRIGNSEKVFIACGGEKTDVFIFDTVTGQFQRQPPMQSDRREAFMGYVETMNAVVVAGGFPYIKTTEIFDLTTNSWNEGNDFPVLLSGGASIGPFQGSFLAIGGRDDQGTNSDDIYWFDPESSQFQILAGDGLAEPRHGFTAMLVKENYFPCP